MPIATLLAVLLLGLGAVNCARADVGEWVFAPHFPFPGVGHIVAAGRGFAW